MGNLEALQLEAIGALMYAYTKYVGEDKKSGKMLRAMQ